MADMRHKPTGILLFLNRILALKFEYILHRRYLVLHASIARSKRHVLFKKKGPGDDLSFRQLT